MKRDVHSVNRKLFACSAILVLSLCIIGAAIVVVWNLWPKSGYTPNGNTTESYPQEVSQKITGLDSVHYVIGCKVYKYSQGEFTDVSKNFKNYSAELTDGCRYTIGVSEGNDIFVNAGNWSNENSLVTYHLDISGQKATKMPRFNNSYNAAYAYNAATKMYWGYNSAEGALFKYAAGESPKLVLTNKGDVAGRGGMLMDDLSVSIQEDGQYLVVNDTYDRFGETGTDATVGIILVDNKGNKVAQLAGHHARWISKTEFVYYRAPNSTQEGTGNIMESKGNLYRYNVETKNSSLVSDTKITPIEITRINSDVVYINSVALTDSGSTYSTYVLNLKTNELKLLATDTYKMRTVSGSDLAFNALKCNVDIDQEFDDKDPSALQCPMDAPTEYYTNKLTDTTNNKVILSFDEVLAY